MHTARILVTTALLTLAGTSFAHGVGAGPTSYNELEWQQEQRIQQGLANGSLTRPEASRLYAEQAQIDELERVFRADGRLSPVERQYLVRLQQRAGQQIFAERHDGQVAWHGR